ncbi:MAG: hypothetical protein V1767_01475 [Chloroflexota bacterium]
MSRIRVSPNETKEQRFRRIAESRTNAILEKIRLLGNLSDTRRYRYSANDVDKIFSVINAQIREVRVKFGFGTKVQFKL